MPATHAAASLRHPDPVDAHVGHRLRIRRVLLGLDQGTLGARVGVSPQQIQKYESGYNRISASRLYDLAHALRVSLDYFFHNLHVAPRIKPSALPPPVDVEQRHAESGALVEAYWALPDAEHRHRLLDLVTLLGHRRQGARHA